MGFRDYPNTKCICITEETPEELEFQIDQIQKEAHIIDLQFSTHFDNTGKQNVFCALLLVQEKES